MCVCVCAHGLTADCGVLLDVLPAQVDVFDQALASVSPALLHRVFGAQSEHRQVLQRQPQPTQALVQLLSKSLAHLVTLILRTETVTK